MDSKIHDYGYSYLFEDPEMVYQLLATCVDESWAKELVIEGLEPMNTNLVDKRLIRRQDDVLLRAKLRGREVFVLIVLEFQSKPDRFMTLRLLNYQCLVWLALVERSRRAKGEPTLRELPPIFPVVLYNGERAWNEPRRLEDLVADADLGDLTAYVPRYTHHLIEEHSFPRARLEEVRNLISALFTLEGASQLSLEERTAKVSEWIHAVAEANPKLVARFMNWVQARFHDDNRRKGEVRAEDIQAPGGIDTMLETAIKKRAEKERQAGREEGIQEGIREGIQEGHLVGRREKQLEVARKALAKGMAPADVAELTDLTLEEVQKLSH
jgi:predicted transposase/invertase (TIGR01784 family)